MSVAGAAAAPPTEVALEALLDPLPAAFPVDAAALSARAAAGRRVVVLDDDPTGTQSIVDLPVLLTWAVEDLHWAFQQDTTAFFVLTNSRSLPEDEAAALNRQIVRAAHEAAQAQGVEYAVASRSDSTLRGHYPLETDVVVDELARVGTHVDGVVIVPAYPDSGRITLDAVHWTPGEHGMIPVAQSESARDATFGFTQSDLRRWVQEKSGGRIAAADVATVDIARLRGGGPDAVAETLATCTDGRPVVVDAATDDDLRVLALAVLAAEAGGRHFVYRTGPSFVRARAGQPPTPPLDRARVRQAFAPTAADGAVDRPAAPGLIVVGSHVGRTTRQLDGLRRAEVVVECELEVDRLLDPARREAHLADVAAQVQAAWDGPGADVVVRTSRRLLVGADARASLALSRSVSRSVADLVRTLVAARRPAFVIAKGGITSADVATRGLSMRRAWCRGTLLPGIVSVWEPVSGPALGVPYVVFAGNVGDDDALATAVRRLRTLLGAG